MTRSSAGPSTRRRGLVALAVALALLAPVAGAAGLATPVGADLGDGTVGTGAQSLEGTLDDATESVDGATDTVDNTTDALDDTTTDATDNTTESVDDTTDTVDNTTDTVDNTTNSTTDNTTDTVDDTTDTVDNTTNSTTDNTTDTVDDTTDVIDNTTDSVDNTTDTLDGTVDDTTDLLESGADSLLNTTDDLLDGGSTDGTGDGADNASGGDTGDSDGEGTAGGSAPADSQQHEGTDGLPGPGSSAPLAAGVTVAVGAAMLAGSRLIATGTHLSGSGGQGGTGAMRTSLRVVGRDAANGVAERLGAVRARLGDWLPWLAGIAGYSRYDDSDPLSHDTRAAIYQLVHDDPGIYPSALAERSDVPLSTLRYHLRILEEEDVLETTRAHGRKQYFPRGEGEVPAPSAAARTVLSTLAGVGSASVSELASRLDRDPSTITHHLDRLSADGLVERERTGREVRNHLTATGRRALAIADGADARTEVGGDVADSADDPLDEADG